MRTVIILLSLFVCLHTAIPQRSESYISKQRLFYEGKAMFENKNYSGCIDKLNEYKKSSSDADLIQESDFLLAACAFRQNRSDAAATLKNYLDTYPETTHRDEVCFMIGSCHFAEKDYNVALYWLNKSDLDNLSQSDQEDHAYRSAFSCLQTNKNDEAFRLFELLSVNSAKYRDAATYYTGYLHYKNKKYNAALPLFNKIKTKKEFQPDVLYYLTQINFVQEKYPQTLKEGIALLENFPGNESNAEVNRMVGISYYKQGDYENTVKYLSQYTAKEKSPGKNDLYLLGLAYYNTQNYRSAIECLSKSAPGNDAMGQNTYLFLGQSYLKLQDDKNALISFESASRMNFDPQAKEAAQYNYAMLLHKTSTSAFGQSVTVLESFLNSYPNSIYADRVNDCLIDVYLTTKNYTTALQSIEKIKNPGKKILEAKQKIFYYLGTVYFTNTDYNNAILYFTKTLEAGNYAPDEKDKALYWKGESYFRLGQYDNALKTYQAYLQDKTAKDNLGKLAQYNLAYCFFQKEQYAQALPAFNAYIKQETDKTALSLADAYARTGDCYFFNRQFSDAESAYSQSAALQPSMADYAIFQKGFVLGLQKDYKGKINQLDKLISSFPGSRYTTDALFEKGRAYVLLEDNPSAIQSFQSILEKYPESNNARKAGLQLGLLYFNSNEPQKAAVAYKKVIEKYPGSDEAKVAAQDLKSVYFELNDVDGYANYIKSLGGTMKFEASEQDSLTYLAAEQFFMKNDIKRAQDGMKKYLISFPDGAFSVNAHYYLGRTYYNQKELALAKPEFKKVVNVGDTKFTEEALFYLGELQYQDKEYADALSSFQRLQTLSESKANKEAAAMGVMRTASQLNQYTDVIRASESLLKETGLNPELTTEANYFRAKAYLGAGENDKALSTLKLLSKDTRTAYGAEAKYLLAQLYFDSQEGNKAETEIMDYIKKGTPHAYWLARSFVLLSDIYLNKGDKLQAKQYLESLQHNYKVTTDDIHPMIEEHLKKIN